MIMGYTGHILVCYRNDTFDIPLVPSYSWLPPPVSVTHRTVAAWQAEPAYIVKVITRAVTQLQT